MQKIGNQDQINPQKNPYCKNIVRTYIPCIDIEYLDIACRQNILERNKAWGMNSGRKFSYGATKLEMLESQNS